MTGRCTLILVLVACVRPQTAAQRPVPSTSLRLGDCGVPERDGVMTSAPRLDRADRDLDSDGRDEIIVVDRAHCDRYDNCYWNVFKPSDGPGACSRYLGTFAGAALELLASTGDANMRAVRAFWKQPSGRLLLQSYRFASGGYALDANDVLECNRPADDRLECADTMR